MEITGRFFTWRGRSVHIAAIRDISERMRTETERLEMERLLLYMQKLESPGILAGLVQDSPVRPSLETSTQAALSPADLTRQMLAYAGKGQFIVSHIDISSLRKPWERREERSA